MKLSAIFYDQEALSYLYISLASSLLLFAFYPIHTGFVIDRILRKYLNGADYSGDIGTQHYRTVGLYGIPIIFEFVLVYVYLLHVDKSTFKPISELETKDISDVEELSESTLDSKLSKQSYPIKLEPPSYNIKMKYVPAILGCGLITILLLGSKSSDIWLEYGGYLFASMTVLSISLLLRALYRKEGSIELTEAGVTIQCQQKAFTFNWTEIRRIHSGTDHKDVNPENPEHMGIQLYEKDFLGFYRFIELESSCGYRRDEFIKFLKHHHQLNSNRT